MAFYLLLTLLCLGAYLFLPNERRATLLAFFLLTLVSALRAETVGVDTPHFAHAFLHGLLIEPAAAGHLLQRILKFFA